MTFQKINTLAGWIVFGISFVVFALTAEPTGSLWDVGEFIAGAQKLQVVHPPGAALFLMLGRMFTLPAELFSDDPSAIAHSVNIMSGVCTAFAAMFMAWATGIFSKLAMVGRTGVPTQAQNIAIAGSALVAGLVGAFGTSVWFSAVEGEVYALATFFTAIVFWAVVKWYHLPDEPQHDRWLIFSVYMAALSIGVHLLSLLTFPALALLYYYKKYDDHNVVGTGAALLAGLVLQFFMQKVIIVGLPTLWSYFELFTVNSLGLPQHSGIIPLVLLLIGGAAFGFRWAEQHQHALAQKLIMAVSLIVIGFSTIGVVVVRANADTPINMNTPSNAMRLIPYLNREQYGERPLLKGQHYDSTRKGTETVDRYDYVEESGQYEKVERKISVTYREEVLFPRLTHTDRKQLYERNWNITDPGSMAQNVGFFIKYQLGWMYWRYFMWNFSGRQNAQQGYMPADKSKGHWISGIDAVDSRLHNLQELPEKDRHDESRNAYFMLPFLLGLIGLFFHARRKPKDAFALFIMFIMTGIAIIVYSNQPPNEPRERDYVLVGSFMTYAMWVGMAIPAIFTFLSERLKNNGIGVAAGATALALIAPALMAFQNWDDHDRSGHYASRDYAANYLYSLEPDAIVFTYGDNDTYPLWYVQEVEGIRTDVRVVNLSLIQVDWYIRQLRRQINDSPAIEMSIPQAAIRGYKRNQLVSRVQGNGPRQSIQQVVKYIGEDHPITGAGYTLESALPTRNIYIPVDQSYWSQQSLAGGTNILSQVNFILNKQQAFKGDVAMLDIIATNFNKRPIYYAITVPQENLLGLQNFVQLEGLGLRLVPQSSQPDPSYQGLRTMGLGKVNGDKGHEIITQRWKWGDFDQHDVFVNEKYGPTLRAMQTSMIRTADALAREGKTQKAFDVVDAYFDKLPQYNFPYNDYLSSVLYSPLNLLRIYVQNGQLERAKPIMRNYAIEVADDLQFYATLDPTLVQTAYNLDFRFSEEAKRQLLEMAEQDAAFKQELEAIFAYPTDLDERAAALFEVE